MCDLNLSLHYHDHFARTVRTLYAEDNTPGHLVARALARVQAAISKENNAQVLADMAVFEGGGVPLSAQTLYRRYFRKLDKYVTNPVRRSFLFDC